MSEKLGVGAEMGLVRELRRFWTAVDRRYSQVRDLAGHIIHIQKAREKDFDWRRWGPNTSGCKSAGPNVQGFLALQWPFSGPPGALPGLVLI